MVLVTDHTFKIVSRSHGFVICSSVNPPQRSATISPLR